LRWLRNITSIEEARFYFRRSNEFQDNKSIAGVDCCFQSWKNLEITHWSQMGAAVLEVWENPRRTDRSRTCVTFLLLITMSGGFDFKASAVWSIQCLRFEMASWESVVAYFDLADSGRNWRVALRTKIHWLLQRPSVTEWNASVSNLSPMNRIHSTQHAICVTDLFWFRRSFGTWNVVDHHDLLLLISNTSIILPIRPVSPQKTHWLFGTWEMKFIESEDDWGTEYKIWRIRRKIRTWNFPNENTLSLHHFDFSARSKRFWKSRMTFTKRSFSVQNEWPFDSYVTMSVFCPTFRKTRVCIVSLVCLDEHWKSDRSYRRCIGGPNTFWNHRRILKKRSPEFTIWDQSPAIYPLKSPISFQRIFGRPRWTIVTINFSLAIKTDKANDRLSLFSLYLSILNSLFVSVHLSILIASEKLIVLSPCSQSDGWISSEIAIGASAWSFRWLK
jgi:hypothetical protein